MSLFTILLGGELVPTDRLARQMAGSRVIAADSGIRHADLLGLVPELWVGDFDSATDDDLARHASVEQIGFQADKDATDGELAVAEAISRGATRLVLAGALGGPRADHAFLNLALGLSLAGEGHGIVLSSGTQEALPIITGTPLRPDLADGTLFSILPFTALQGLTLAGAKWPLDAVSVPFGSSLTISNEVRGSLVVTLEAGRAMLLAHPGGA
jgi:thiamine pyrophosphokinase